MRPDSIIIHTVARRGDTPAEEIKRWHTDPKPVKHGFRYLGKIYPTRASLPEPVKKRQGRGWLDIGYHYVIRKNGEIEQGRKETRQGAHCSAGGMNAHSLGICFAGHGDFEEFTPEQLAAFQQLYNNLFTRWEILPDRVYGHREFDPNKTCPGKLINLNKFRQSLTLQL